MQILPTILLWLHFLGLAMALGGGIALSQTGPRLITVPDPQRELIWTLEETFSRISMIGLGILVVSGPLMVWLIFGGFAGFNWWFGAKMILVAVALVAVGVHQWAGRRFRAGDRSGYPLMLISGRTAGLSMVFVVLCAVLAFN